MAGNNTIQEISILNTITPSYSIKNLNPMGHIILLVPKRLDNTLLNNPALEMSDN